MKRVEPKVWLLQRPHVDWDTVRSYLREVGEDALQWAERMNPPGRMPATESEAFVEFAGRLCYRSWAPGLNPNVLQVREDSAEYDKNLLSSGHGSVLEHENFSFVLRHVSRVLTHELVRHRAGCAYSQESLRYVRFDHLPIWFPDWSLEDDALMLKLTEWLQATEELQTWMASHFQLDRPDAKFKEKKLRTSFMRRFAPMGVATDIVMTMNIRTLRHVIYMRTSLAAEEEIRIVFDKVAQICEQEFPLLMQDYNPNEWREWVPEWIKP